MSEQENKQPADVLQTKRLEIVDEEGKVRAVLRTNEEGVTSLSVFDQSERLRTSLDASENPEQSNGLGVFDSNGGRQLSAGASAVNANQGGLLWYGPNGVTRASMHVNEKGAFLFFNNAEGEDRVG